MNKNVRYNLPRLKKYFLGFIKIQLFITLVSFPILAAWGLPISLMTLVGNFTFSPLLTIFLLLSSLIFLTELLFLPNTFLISSLSFVVFLWEKLLFLGSKRWLFGLNTTTISLLLFLFILIFFLRKKLFQKRSAKIKSFTSVFIIFLLLIFKNIFFCPLITKTFKVPPSMVDKKRSTPPRRHNLPRRHSPPQTMTIKNTPPFFFKKPRYHLPRSMIQIIDHGYLSRKKSPQKFVAFELKPYIIKTHGTKTIEKISLHKPSTKSFCVVKELFKYFVIKQVAVAYFKKLPYNGFKHFFELKELCEKEGTLWKRFKSKVQPSTKVSPSPKAEPCTKDSNTLFYIFS